MRHVDEGTLHALLDHELTADEAGAVEAHLADCDECSRLMEGARLFVADADGLLAALAPPAAGEGRADRTDRTDRAEEPAFIGSALPEPEPHEVAGGMPEPVILIPPEPEAPLPVWERRRTSRGPLGLIAAALVLTAAGGYVVFGNRGGGAAKSLAPMVPSVAFDVPASGAEVGGGDDTAPATSPVVREPIEPPAHAAPARETPPPAARRQEPAVAARPDSEDSTPADSGTPEPATAPPPAVAASAAPAAPVPARADRPAPRETPAEIAARLRRAEEARRATMIVSARENARRAAVAADNTAPAAGADAAAAPASSTAATPSAPSASPVSPSPTAAAEEARAAADRRYGITMRLGLDEVHRILNGPLHVIDGYRPLVTGLTAPGVVRAVYTDAAGHLITLDQRRGREGRASEPQITTSGNRSTAEWAIGDVSLTLSAAMPADDFRSLVRRVR
ncbi:MAG TPA: zf-HC2 domain-containing protein [Gemmatimonadales bacterium]|nr:zf-HC2 domain-containing protein [Gemmatimonadales bacterium]